jgi:SNF2 family DNA or RNA helicase
MTTSSSRMSSARSNSATAGTDSAPAAPPPFEHQRRATEAMISQPRLCIWYEPGTGKTRACLDAIHRLGRDNKWLVLCPSSVMRTAWEADCKRFTPHLKLRVLWGDAAQRRAAIGANDWQIGVLNYESFTREAEYLKRVGVNCLILDESTKIKNPVTERSRAVAKFAKDMSRVYALSGSPAPNDPSEYINQVLTVNSAAFTGGVPSSYYSVFTCFMHQPKARIKGRMVSMGRPSLISAQGPRFWDAIGRSSILARKADCLDLPPQMDIELGIELSRKESRAYSEMTSRLRTEIDGEQMSVASVAGKLMKLRQITSGFMYNDSGTASWIGTSKLDTLKELLDETLSGRQVLIWSVFTAEIDAVMELLAGRGIGRLDGHVSPGGRMDVVNRFKDNRLQYIVAHPAAAGHGTNGLQVASDSVLLSMDFSSDNLGSPPRAGGDHEGGREGPVGRGPTRPAPHSGDHADQPGGAPPHSPASDEASGCAADGPGLWR